MTALPDHCHRCLCSECNGTTAQHTDDGCVCGTCIDYPEYACVTFHQPHRITYLAEQLAPLLSVHLGERQRVRCLIAAHAAHHALNEHDDAGDIE